MTESEGIFDVLHGLEGDIGIDEGECNGVILQEQIKMQTYVFKE